MGDPLRDLLNFRDEPSPLDTAASLLAGKMTRVMDGLLLEDAFRAVERGHRIEDLAVGVFPGGEKAIVRKTEPGEEAELLGPHRRVVFDRDDTHLRARVE